jgi:Phosphodiester glycosidase
MSAAPPRCSAGLERNRTIVIERHKKWLRGLIVSIGVPTVILVGAWIMIGPASWLCRGAGAASEIFQGVTYGCEQLRPTEEGRGLIHWARVDLTAPGVGLYVTPLDAAAVAHGRQYRLRRIKDAVSEEKLAVAINGSLFTSDSPWWFRMPGDFASSVETVVADHVASHLWEHTYLLWFDDALTPHLRPGKPPTAAELAAAKWGIGGQGVGLRDGEVPPGSDRNLDSRTAVAIDAPRKLLYLAIGQHISPRRMLQELADLGAKDGMLLDGGSSSSMAIGDAATGIAAGRYGGWRPVATQFGVRALPLSR